MSDENADVRDVLDALDALPGGQGLLLPDQIGAARDRIIPAPDWVRWTSDGLHRITGPLLPGELWLVAAQSGIGKTTFTLSAIHDWVQAGVKVCLVPTELEDWEARRALACLAAGVDPGIAAANEWSEHADGMTWMRKVDTALRLQAQPPYSDHLLVLPYREVNATVIAEAAAIAADFGAQVFIVDHMDHLDYGKNVFGASGKIARAGKAAAEEHAMTVVGMKQIHNDAARGDPLARYFPPKLHQLQGGALMGQNASVVMGLYRPLLPLVGDEGRKKLKAVRAHLIEPTEVLQWGVLGVVTVKHRRVGRLEGQRALLTLDNGKLRDRT